MSSKRVTIRDVAAAAGVSAATVSYYLNRPGRLSAETAERVRRAIRRLNFKVRPKTRGRSAAERGMLALLIPDSDPFACRTPLSLGLLTAALEFSSRHGLPILPLMLRPDGTLPLELTADRVDGVICRGTKSCFVLADCRLPLVSLFERSREAFPEDVIRVNDMALGELAARILLEHGRRRTLIPVNLIGGLLGRTDISVRLSAFFETFGRGGGEAVRGEFRPDKPREIRDRFDSIFVPAEDMIEFDLVRLLYGSGIDPVRDVELIPFFNAPLIPESLSCDLNYLYVSSERLVGQAAEALLDRIRTPGAASRTLLTAPEYREFRAVSRLFPERGRLFGNRSGEWDFQP